MLKARREALQTQNTLEELGRQNRTLTEKLKLSGELVRREGALWLDGAQDPGPYCTACWDRKRDAIRLNVNIAGAFCPACEEAYDISAETRAKHGFPPVGVNPILR